MKLQGRYASAYDSATKHSQVAVNVLMTGEYSIGVPASPSAEPVKRHVVLVDLDGKWDIRRFIAVRTKWVLRAWTLCDAIRVHKSHC